jgi:hypothetical protein
VVPLPINDLPKIDRMFLSCLKRSLSSMVPIRTTKGRLDRPLMRFGILVDSFVQSTLMLTVYGILPGHDDVKLYQSMRDCPADHYHAFIVFARAQLATVPQDVGSSFERFCLTAGIGAIEHMLRENAQKLVGALHGRGGGRLGPRWGRTKGKIGFHGANVAVHRSRVHRYEGP